MIRFSTLFCLLLVSLTTYGQGKVFVAKSVNIGESSILSKTFKSYQVYDINSSEIHKYFTSSSVSPDVGFIFGNDHSWSLEISENNIMKPGMMAKVHTENGIELQPVSKIKHYIGYRSGTNDKAAFSVNEGFFLAEINTPTESYFIEPLWHTVPDAPRNYVLMYKKNDHISSKEFKCGLDDLQKQNNFFNNQQIGHDHDHDGLEEAVLAPTACKEVQIGLASDKSMCTKYGSIANVQDHISSIINLVQVNYIGQFNDDLQYVISDWVNISCSGTDPWTNSTNASTFLSSFTAWGPGGFGTHDIGECWTNRDFDGGTVGIAWVGTVCTSNRYNCIQDWTNNDNLLRVTVAHEFGHNWNYGHDAASNFIMSPTVNNTSTWSAASKTAINAFIPTRNCLSACIGGTPPQAEFTSNKTEGCKPLTVNFTDQSTNTPTSWLWTFPGGTPATSIAKNPTVVYNSAGVYNVTLKATNSAGSDTETKVNYITVFDKPTANFTFVKNLGIVDFTNTSSGGTSFFWEFGDGENSNDENPQHEYFAPGTYNVKLTVGNLCGTSTITKSVLIVFVPLADFSSNVVTGCAPLTVSFSDESEFFPTSWKWSFPGANPNSSTLANPVVTYNVAGQYDVTLTATNSAGSNTITIEKYITVKAKPIAGFAVVINGYTATFTNTTGGIDNTWKWFFGDGDSSIVKSPVHTYKNPGTYTVTLTAENDCGKSSFTSVITIAAIPKANFTSNKTTGCTPLNVNYTDISTNAPNAWSWSFPGGIPAVSNAQNPIVNYNTGGVYDVTLIATNALGSDTIKVSNYINALSVPVAGFNASVNGNVVNFTNTSTFGGTYLWDFGDGNSSTNANPVHTYTAEGTYTVTLTATNICGANTVTKTVVVVFPPTAAFSADQTNGCASLVVNFTNNSSASATFFNWTFDGGTPSTSTIKNPTVTYVTPGTYAVTLVAGNSGGNDTVTITSYIIVAGPPVPSYFYVNSNGFTNFNNTTINGASYSWDFGDGQNSTLKNPSHKYAAEGSYTVVMIATNDCGSVTITTIVNVVLPPNAQFNSDNKTGCNNQTITFEDLSSPNTISWAWEFTGGTPSSSTEKNPTISYGSVGSYDVTLIATNSAGSDTIVKSGYVLISNAAPIASFNYNNVGLSFDFSNTSADAYSYNWNFGDGGLSNDENPNHDYTASGDFTVTLIVVNGCGSDTITQQVTVVGTPPIGDFGSNVTSGCLPLVVTYQDGTVGGATSWAWTFPGGEPATSTEENPTVTYNAGGIYDVELIVSNSYGSDTIKQINYIAVGSAPIATYTYTKNGSVVNFQNQTIGATNYLWNFGDGITSTEENPIHAYAGLGQYTVTLTATNECGSFTLTQTITITVGTNEIEAFESVIVTPNPSNGQFRLNINSSENLGVEMKVVDMLGRLVWSKPLEVSKGFFTQEISIDKPSGQYLLILTSNNKLSIQKLIVQ